VAIQNRCLRSGVRESDVDYGVVSEQTNHRMKTITVSKAKAQFSGIARRVVKTKEPVTISTPAGLVQLIPWDLPAVVEPFTPGTIHMTDEEVRLANTLGETFGEETP
jgi:hypothetical protein